MISVLIPYWSTDPHRDRIFNWIYRRWKALLPDGEICVADSDVGSRSAARNVAFASCKGDVIVVADADTMVRYQALRTALSIVSEPDQRTWVLPYTTYFNLTQSYTAELLFRPPDINPPDPDDWDYKLITAESGVMVMTRETWETVGGYDESFIGWGYEDNAQALALDTLWGQRTCVPSSVFHLWHDVPVDGAFNSPMIETNRARFRRYQSASGHPSRMAQLRGSP